MSGRLGLSGLLRLATLLTLAALFLASGLIAGCASSRPTDVAHHAAEEKEGWSRCDHAHTPALSVICFQR
ncbi:MAG TPA: hypothetical protein VED20_00130 [Streptosporangiaceae bacterium]|nr:hypothetical protein [Streptosporangiaceae bacterium]